MSGSARLKKLRKRMDDEMIVEGETIVAFKLPGVPEPMIWDAEKGHYGPVDPDRAEKAHTLLILAGGWHRGTATDEEKAKLLPKKWRKGYLDARAKLREDITGQGRGMVVLP